MSSVDDMQIVFDLIIAMLVDIAVDDGDCIIGLKKSRNGYKYFELTT